MLKIDRKPHQFSTCDELKIAEILLIKLVQSIYFCDVIEYYANVNLSLAAIVRQLDLKFVNDVILCEGRLSFSCLKVYAKFPILLSSKCYLTNLIIIMFTGVAYTLGLTIFCL